MTRCPLDDSDYIIQLDVLQPSRFHYLTTGIPITRIETTANDCFNRDRMGYAGITDVGKYESYILEDGDLLMSHINSIQYLGRTIEYRKSGDEIIIHGMNLLGLRPNRDCQ